MIGRAISSARKVQEFGALVEEVALVEGLGEDVRDVVLGRDVLDADGGVLHELLDLQVASLDVLRALVGGVVVGQVDGALVV